MPLLIERKISSKGLYISLIFFSLLINASKNLESWQNNILDDHFIKMIAKLFFQEPNLSIYTSLFKEISHNKLQYDNHVYNKFQQESCIRCMK